MADTRRNIDWYEMRLRTILKEGDKKAVNKWIKDRLKVSERKSYDKKVLADAKARVYLVPAEAEIEIDG